jgi:hypothetical protein
MGGLLDVSRSEYVTAFPLEEPVHMSRSEYVTVFPLGELVDV